MLRMATWVAASAVVLAACSSGTGGGGTDSSDGSGGLPGVSTPAKVITQTLDDVGGKKVRMVLLSDANALQQSWVQRAKIGFEESGIDFAYTVSNYDNQVLAQQVQTVIDQKADALIVQNSDVSGLASLIKKAQDAGIYVIVLNLGSNAQSDAFVGPNWDGMSAKLATRVAEDCSEKGKKDVAIISGFGSDSGSVLAVQGATRVFKEKGMKIVATQPGQYDPSKAGDVARTLLQQNPGLCAFIGNWDGMMLGVSKVVHDANLDGKVGVYTMDSSAGSCKAIGEGTLTAAVNYGGGTAMGDSAVAITQYLMQGGVKAGSSKTAVFTATTIIDKTNNDDPGACYDTPVGWSKN